MCSKKLEQDINKLLDIVNEFDPDAAPSVDGIIEVVEAAPANPKPPIPPKPRPLLPPKPPPPGPPPNFLQRSFSFVGTLPRAYFAKNTAALLVLSGVVITMIDERVLDEGWGLLLLALAFWAFAATLVKRWRDTGYDLRWLLTLIVPYAGLVTAAFVLFAPTKKGP